MKNTLLFLAFILTPSLIISQNTFPTAGNVGIGTTPIGKLDINTGTSATFDISGQGSGIISIGNAGSIPQPSIISKTATNNASGLILFAGTSDISNAADMRFDVRKNDNNDFTTLTTTAFRFGRFTTPLVDILRNGTVQIKTSDAKLIGGDNPGRLILSNPTTTSYIQLDGSTNTNPNKLSLITTSGTIGMFTNGTEKVSILNNGNMYVGNTAFGTSKINSSVVGVGRVLEINREDAPITPGITSGAGLCLSTVPFQNGLNSIFGNNMLGYSKNPLESIGIRALTVPLSDTGTEPIIKLEASGASTNAFSGIKVADTRPILGVYNYSNQLFNIQANGNVGIGTTTPTSKLTVNGTIHATEVKVTSTVTPDYVFEKYYLGQSSLKPDYTLLTLSEIEKFTKTHHHLPNVPSAKEIKENGLHLGEMSNILLQKIEELTLYSIEQQKVIEKLEKENESFKSLSQRLSQIENQLKNQN